MCERDKTRKQEAVKEESNEGSGALTHFITFYQEQIRK